MATLNPYRHTHDRGARSTARPDLCLKDLAAKLAIHPSHLGRILRGKAKPSLKLAEKLAGELGQTVDELISDIREPGNRQRRTNRAA